MLKIETGRAKATFSEVKKRARTEDVAVTRHGKVEVYLVSPERYDQFMKVAEAAPDAIKKLEDEYRQLFEKMQTPEAGRFYRSLATTPLEEILAKGALRKRSGATARDSQKTRTKRTAARR